MTTIEVNKILIFDPISIATIIEAVAEPYLRPAIGQVIDLNKLNTVALGANTGRYLYADKDLPYKNKEQELPIRGIAIMNAYIERLLGVNSAWVKHYNPSLVDIWGVYVLAEYANTPEVFDLIENQLCDIRTDILEFIGKNHWLMHFQRMRKNDIIIEQSIDYRVYQWCLEHPEEWKTNKR